MSEPGPYTKDLQIMWLQDAHDAAVAKIARLAAERDQARRDYEEVDAARAAAYAMIEAHGVTDDESAQFNAGYTRGYKDTKAELAALREENGRLLRVEEATRRLCGALSLWRPGELPEPQDYTELIYQAWNETADAIAAFDAALPSVTPGEET